jgi:bla regulator protein blaR1
MMHTTYGFMADAVNHLWQSTLFALAVAVLTFALRKNHAKTRYTLWLIASLKFLIPFSFLLAVGQQIRIADTTTLPHPALAIAAKQVREAWVPGYALPSFTANAHPSRFSAVEVSLVGVWSCGFLAVLFSFLRSWLRMRAVVHRATAMPFEAGIPVLSSDSSIEPGVFGIFRPVLLLPTGITEHLTASHLQSIVAHELCHVRRRDNFTAAVHMLVEAVFWFHPLVWFIGTRLMEERERACDEEVLRLGRQPRVYAESILKTCQFYLESPTPAFAGVTGSDLKKRIVRIMGAHGVARLNRGKKLLLALAAASALAIPLSIGAMNRLQTSGAPQFEVASVKPMKSIPNNIFFRMTPGGGFSANGITAKFLLEEAYGVKDEQVTGMPSWMDSERWDVEAKADEQTAAAFDKLPPEQRRQQLMLMLQALLADRFNLKLTRETKELPVYVLAVAKNGPKLQESTYKPPEKSPDTPRAPGIGGGAQQGVFLSGRGQLTEQYGDMDMLANVLSRFAGRPVLNKTGLTGKYDFTLKWTPDEGTMPPGAPKGSPDDAPPPEPSGPSLFTAVQEQLGLKLEAQRAPMDVLVIQHVERPSEN